MPVLDIPRRRDSLPEEHDYRDTGCNLAPSCLACPFESCRYDLANGFQLLRARERQRQILSLLASGLTASEAAARVGVHKRTAYRAAEGVPR